MITTTFNGVPGSGLRLLLIVPMARATYSQITVVSPMREILTQWQKLFPEAACMTMHSWLKRADDPAGSLVIVDGMQPNVFPQYAAMLESVSSEVWLVGLEQWHLPGNIRRVFARNRSIAQLKGGVE